MEFRLIYRGILKANGNKEHKHKLRQAFHVQLKELWKQPPLKGYEDWAKSKPFGKDVEIGGIKIKPFIISRMSLNASLNILLLRPQPPGALITAGGDIDNRLKTLFDALRMPLNKGELPNSWNPDPEEIPFYCLLEDDSLVVNVSVVTDRLLVPVTGPSEVNLIIHVRVGAMPVTIGNLGFLG